jgi:hypothetical protein
MAKDDGKPERFDEVVAELNNFMWRAGRLFLFS